MGIADVVAGHRIEDEGGVVGIGAAGSGLNDTTRHRRRPCPIHRDILIVPKVGVEEKNKKKKR